MDERQLDEKLHIHTVGRDATHSDAYHHPYEPTPYSVLQRLEESGLICRSDHVVDYGCGKGRVGFYLHRALGCRVTGVEYDPAIYAQAEENLRTYGENEHIRFVCCPAERFIPEGATCLYFFNPFTVEILRSVLRKAVDSYYEHPRPIRMFFYYPDDAYLSLLLAGDPSGLTDEIFFLDEIYCGDLFGGNDSRERIMVFQLGGWQQ